MISINSHVLFSRLGMFSHATLFLHPGIKNVLHWQDTKTEKILRKHRSLIPDQNQLKNDTKNVWFHFTLLFTLKTL